jgi:hypothetical protein
MSLHILGEDDSGEKDREEDVAWDKVECIVRVEVILSIRTKLLRIYA